MAQGADRRWRRMSAAAAATEKTPSACHRDLLCHWSEQAWPLLVRAPLKGCLFFSIGRFFPESTGPAQPAAAVHLWFFLTNAQEKKKGARHYRPSMSAHTRKLAGRMDATLQAKILEGSTFFLSRLPLFGWPAVGSIASNTQTCHRAGCTPVATISGAPDGHRARNRRSGQCPVVLSRCP